MEVNCNTVGEQSQALPSDDPVRVFIKVSRFTLCMKRLQQVWMSQSHDQVYEHYFGHDVPLMVFTAQALCQ